MPYTLTVRTDDHERRAVTVRSWPTTVEAFHALTLVRSVVRRAGILIATVGSDAGYDPASLRVTEISQRQTENLAYNLRFDADHCHEELVCLKCGTEDFLQPPPADGRPRTWLCAECSTWNEFTEEAPHGR